MSIEIYNNQDVESLAEVITLSELDKQSMLLLDQLHIRIRILGSIN
jgi:hypothetical protein